MPSLAPPFAWTALGPAAIQTTDPGNPTWSGRITGIAVDNLTGAEYVTAAGGGVWKSLNQGKTWVPLTFDQPTLVMSAIALAPNGSLPEIIYAATGDIDGNAGFRNYSTYGIGILKSADGGQTWTLLTGQTPGNPNANVFNRHTISKIVVDPAVPTTIYAAVNGGGDNGLPGDTGIWKSTDAGVTWVNTTVFIDSVDNWSDLVIAPSFSQNLYAALATPGGGAYRSTDGGGSWFLAGNFPQNNHVGRISLASSQSSPNTVYAAIADPTNNNDVYEVLQTTNANTANPGSISWQSIGNFSTFGDQLFHGQGGYGNVIAVDPANSNHVYVAGYKVWQGVGTPFGFLWTKDPNKPLKIHDDQHSFAFQLPSPATGGPYKLLVGTDGGIYRLDDPSNWVYSDLNGNLDVTQFYHVALDPNSSNNAYGTAQDNGTSEFTGGMAWTSREGADAFNVAVSPNQGNSLIYTSASAAFERNYAGVSSPLLYGGGYFVVDPNKYPSGQDRVLFSGGPTNPSSTMAESTDSGNNWHQIMVNGWPVDGNGNSVVSVINFDLSAAHPNTIYAVIQNSVSKAYGTLVTVDDGQNWFLLDPPPDASDLQNNFSQSDFHVDPANDHLVYAVDNSGRVYEGQLTTDASGMPTKLSWQDITGSGLPTSPVDGGPASLYAVAAYPLGLQDRILYVGTDFGVYSSVNDGTTWQRVGDPNGFPDALPNARVVDLEMQNYPASTFAGGTVVGNVLAAGTYGLGMWETGFGVTASVVNGNLQIYGDGNNDVITVALDPNNPALDVWQGGPHSPFDQLVGSFALAGLTGVTVTVQNTDNTINIEDSVAGAPVTINLGFGSNTVNISPFAQTLDNIQANVAINPGAGSVALNIDDQQAKVFLAKYSLTSSSVDRGTGTIFFSGVDTLTLNGNASAVYNVFNTESFSTGTTTTINTGAGFATVNVYNNDNGNNTLNIVGNGGGGNDVVNLGNGGSVQGILGPVNIENPPSFDHINIDDSADPNTLPWFLSTLGSNAADSEGNGDIWGHVAYGSLAINYEYADTSSLTLNTGTGAGINVEVMATNSQNLGCQTNIVSHAPTNVYVGDSSRAFDAQGLASTLNLENPSTPSGDTIIVDDSLDGQARTATLRTLGTNPADSEQNADGWGQISDLAPGNINYEIGDVGTLTMDGSGGGTTFNVSAVPNTSVVLNGDGGTNTLNGPNQVNAWTLNGKNAGVLDGHITFKPPKPFGDGFQNLAGGNLSDTFTLSSAVPVAMNLVLNSPGQLTNPSGTQTLTGTVNTNGHLLTVAGPGSITLQGVVSGSGALSMQGTGTLTLAAANSYGGGTTVASGILVAAQDGALGAAKTITIVDAGATLALSGGITYATPESLFLNGTGNGGAGALESLGGAANKFESPVTQQSDSTINTLNTLLTLTGPVMEGPFLLTVTGAGNTTIQGAINGSGGLSKQGTGTLTLAAANTYTGTTTIVSGLLVASHDAALGAANTSTVVDTGAILGLSGGINYTTVENVTLNGSPAGVCLLNLSGANTFSGPITLLAPSGISSSAGSLALTGAVMEGANLLTVVSNGNVTFKGVISGSGGLTVLGSATVTLTANNTYTGPTTTSGGTLIVNGTQTSSAITVNAGGTLAGTGSVGAVTVKSGGIVEPGPLGGIGILTASSADFSNGGNLLIQIQGYQTPGVDYDQLIVTNTLTLGGTSSITFDEMNNLSKKGTAAGIVKYPKGGLTGQFSSWNVINGTGLLPTQFAYGAKNFDVTFK
jgi:autotransporter-associated beta strand protein